VYAHARKAAARGTLAAQNEKLLKRVDAVPHGAGGVASMTLVAFAEALANGITPAALPPLGELEERHAKLGLRGLARDDGFPALVRASLKEARRPPWQRALTHRDIAAIAILCEAAPTGWKGYERKIDDGDRVVTPAVVIEDVETRVRKILETDAAAIRPG
jgi:hypothetical protein